MPLQRMATVDKLEKLSVVDHLERRGLGLSDGFLDMGEVAMGDWLFSDIRVFEVLSRKEGQRDEAWGPECIMLVTITYMGRRFGEIAFSSDKFCRSWTSQGPGKGQVLAMVNDLVFRALLGFGASKDSDFIAFVEASESSARLKDVLDDPTRYSKDETKVRIRTRM